MKTFTLSLLFTIFAVTAFGQVIKGTILEDKTDNPVPFATVYFSGTFVGTLSDHDGKFRLDISKNKSMPLTVSAIGYYSATLTDFSKNDTLMIYLQPKIYELKDVDVAAKSLERKRKRNLRLFREEFLGTTPNALKCKILNEKDITFNYDSDEDTLKAYAMKPVLVENKALGYKITYYLDKFEHYRHTNTFFFSGNIIFNEDLTADQTEKQHYKEKREDAYWGSRMHFFRVLWSGSLTSSGFSIENASGKNLPIKEIVHQDIKHNKFFGYSGNLTINYLGEKSIVEFHRKYVYFDKTGFFNPGILWTGKMAVQRIADWLPYEYSVK